MAVHQVTERLVRTAALQPLRRRRRNQISAAALAEWGKQTAQLVLQVAIQLLVRQEAAQAAEKRLFLLIMQEASAANLAQRCLMLRRPAGLLADAAR